MNGIGDTDPAEMVLVFPAPAKPISMNDHAYLMVEGLK